MADERRDYERRYVFSEPPKLELGVTVMCPKCKGRTTITMDKKTLPCPRCAGQGLVPNIGPIARPKGKV